MSRITEKQERIYYEVRYDGPYEGSFTPHRFKTILEAQDYINRYGHDEWMTYEHWLELGKSQENWDYWVNVYANHAYIVQVVETIYPL